MQTRDEYFAGQKQYRKPGYANKGNYRKSVVVDSNRNDELAVVKLYSKSGTELVKTESRYKPFVEIFITITPYSHYTLGIVENQVCII